MAPLILGGCVRIPSDFDRLNDVVGSFSSLEANWALLTPSFARNIAPEDVPSLKTLCLAGEAVSKGDKDKWTKRLKLIVGYGPAGVSLCTAGSLADDKYSPPTIGHIVRGLGWIVELSDHTKLAPLGAIGELLVEGPFIARGHKAS